MSIANKKVILPVHIPKVKIFILHQPDVKVGNEESNVSLKVERRAFSHFVPVDFKNQNVSVTALASLLVEND